MPASLTPGPWEVVPSGPQFDDDLFVRQCPDGRGYGKLICRVLNSKHDPHAGADARLLAVAPNLLAACELALPHLVHEPAADAVRAAIAEAKGDTDA